MKLVIVESPAKAKTIEKYLGSDYKVVASVGHIRDLDIGGERNFGVDMNSFKAKYVVSPDKKDVVSKLKKFSTTADEIFLAADPDREGEAIAWHVHDELKLRNKKVSRVVFNEITKSSILKAFENTRNIDMNLVESQEARRILDRIVGFELSKYVKNKVGAKSAGRVQSAALKIIKERDDEIISFIPVEFGEVHGIINSDNKEIKVKFDNSDNISFNEVEKIVKECNNKFVVTDVLESDKSSKNYMPFTTSTLQQAAASKLSFKAEKTMKIAQQLYEGIEINGESTGLITYMRTDSVRLSDEFQNSAKNYVSELYGEGYATEFKAPNAKDNVQDAHESVRPTNITFSPESIKEQLSQDQFKLYDLIWRRTLAALIKPAVLKEKIVLIKSNNVDFKLIGTSLIFDGYYKVLPQKDDVVIPDYKIGDEVAMAKIWPEKKFTKPPKRYSEATLIKKLEKSGVGRPSTYASILSTIEQRGYVEILNNSYKVTSLGKMNVESLSAEFMEIIQENFTSEVESKLDEIADGRYSKKIYLTEFCGWFLKKIDQLQNELKKKYLEQKKLNQLEKIKAANINCNECGSAMIERKGNYGIFYGCTNYPKCKNIQKLKDTNSNK